LLFATPRELPMRRLGLCVFNLLAAARVFVASLAAGSMFVSCLALAEPSEKTEENADENFANSFVGKNYEGDLEIEGWGDLGGGLVAPPVYVHQYQREDGTFLVLTSREQEKAKTGAAAAYVVADALIVPPPKKGAQFSISCVKGDDETLKYMGEAKGSESKEWWTDVRRAWEIALDTGEIAELEKTKGIRCTNVSWGQ
jgi:hypothetical protein